MSLTTTRIGDPTSLRRALAKAQLDMVPDRSTQVRNTDESMMRRAFIRDLGDTATFRRRVSRKSVRARTLRSATISRW